MHLDTGISWVRAHIGSNEGADERALFESILGEAAGSPHTAMEGGIGMPKVKEQQERSQGESGLRRRLREAPD